MKMNEYLLKNIKNFTCLCDKNSDLVINSISLDCGKCKKKYKKIEEKFFFSDQFFDQNKWNFGENPDYLEREKSPKIPDRIGGPRLKELEKYLKLDNKAEPFYVNLGGGSDKIEKFINIDLGNYRNVDIVASLDNLPIKSMTVDLLLSNSVLEHVNDYRKVISEANRILKVGGYFYLCVPLLSPKHHIVDYQRWTIDGLKKLFNKKNYEFLDEGVCRSSAYTLVYILESILVSRVKKGILRSVLRKLIYLICSPLINLKIINSDLEKAYANTVYIVLKKIKD